MPNGDDQLDVVQHPTLGPLKFPKDMPFDQRNALIQEEERKAKTGRGAGVPPGGPSPFRQVLGKVAETAGDIATGAAKGLGSTVSGVSGLLHGIPKVGETLVPTAGLGAFRQLTRPEGTAQKVGYGAEQTAEFLVPGGAEQRLGLKAAELLPMLGRAAPVLGRLGTGALTTGAINKLQGGEFGTGALLGAGTGAVGEAARAAAPGLAESALGITKRLRGYGKTPGEAVLGEVKGIRPGTVAENAQREATRLTRQMEQMAEKSKASVSTLPALDVVGGEMRKAIQENAADHYNELQKIWNQLTKRFQSGEAIPEQLPARELLDIKRGIGKLNKTWNPETHGAVKDVVQQVYHAIDAELDRALPGTAGMNQRISSLITAEERAESTARGAGAGQRILGRFARPTGALAPAGLGAALEYHRGGSPLAGAAAGVLGSELLASPTVQLGIARTLRSPVAARAGRGLASQLLGREGNQ